MTLLWPRQGLRFSGSNSTEDIVNKSLEAADAPWLCSWKQSLLRLEIEKHLPRLIMIRC